tara:strand:- start:266 stop:430 length:165 start_codon:yes stop_codon:yes gene_type:complete
MNTKTINLMADYYLVGKDFKASEDLTELLKDPEVNKAFGDFIDLFLRKRRELSA